MPDLPPAIAAYYAADHSASPEALGAFFAADAHVHDERHDHVGLDAISTWRRDTYARTPYTARPLEMFERDGAIVVRAEVSGSFPNSPIILDHTFTLIDGLIASLDIR
ncbi:hypothetical protein MB02_01890 [Croceicoccus estronivorus]|uniref:nuclear transport factor 2 family protein n=1 Tax=Croceicoccus estronivorus TaxID=1172626 RepID=UPI0008346FBB|nr:nuclear transport factor 2 family protein [Croceicoccus estronivorus]OCC25425.1 hypothetical protein MB02_01890 [Croceicoccus estronivorus]